jgi:hypothetical protein
MIAASTPVWITIVAAVGGGVVAAIVNQLGSQYRDTRSAHDKADHTQMSIGRVLHEDCLRFQSTLARALLRGTWWTAPELLAPQVGAKEMLELAGVTPPKKWEVIALAIGWVDYLRSIGGAADRPDRPQVVQAKTFARVYNELDVARYALCTFAERDYHPHDASEMRKAATEWRLSLSRRQRFPAPKVELPRSLTRPLAEKRLSEVEAGAETA